VAITAGVAGALTAEPEGAGSAAGCDAAGASADNAASAAGFCACPPRAVA
jgi:hypothetical protein